ncbi:autotransporter outer membrane beta-barrel domain-containing protein, partial [Phyllobacterium sp. YR531]|uniref:autotransporter outer membrane beta-barrel domain-containing protein n=1 Tax=Phyllobacterium sp. YR531 TaxID=1144343 RepID=UPI00026F98F0
ASIVNDTGLFTVEGIAAATTVNKGGRLNVAAGGTAGDTSVIGGFAAINGASGATSVSEGGTVFGTGTLESLVAKSGGIVSPGNSVGTLNVSKDATFEKGSVFNVEIKPDFLSADQLAIAGEAMLLGGIVNVRLENDTALLTEDVTKSLFLKSFDIVTASKGVTGQFDGVWPRYNYITANLDYADRNKVVLGFDFTPDVKTAKIVELEKQLAALEAEKARLAEVKRIADEKAAEAEAKRIADEAARLAAEEAEKVKQAEEAEALAKAAADAKKLADQKAEEDRIAADRKRIADEKAAEAEAKRIADEDARLAAEEAEKVKQAEEAETLAKAAADAKKLADQKAEEDRIAADKKRIADEKAAEAEAKRVADEDARLAAEEAEKVKKAEEAEALAKAAADAKKLADQKAKDALEKKLLEAKLEAYLSPEYLAIGVKSRNQKGVWKGIQSAGWDNPLLAQVAV